MTAKLGYVLWATVIPLFAATITVAYYYGFYCLIPLAATLFAMIAGAYLVANARK